MVEHIERDSTLKKMWNALYALEDKREQEKGLDVDRRLDIQAGFEAGQQAVVNMPAADVAPVKRGKWIWDENGMDWGLGAWVCSECHAKSETWWGDIRIFNPLRCSGSRFCGNCGAKMDGEV